MSAPAYLGYVAPVLALLNISISIPLVMGKVPPNKLYGFRTRKTLNNESIWYQANYSGGQNLLIANVIALIGLAAARLEFNGPFVVPAELALVATATVVASVVSLIQIKKM